MRTPKAKPKPRPRTSFRFPAEAVAALEAITPYSRATSAADTIRAALSAYDEILTVVLAGGRVLVRGRAGGEWLYSPFAPFSYPGMKDLVADVPADGAKKTPGRNFFFSGDAVIRLDSIRKRSFAHSKADAIRVALSAYRELIGVIAAEDEIVIQDRAGRERPYDPRAPMIWDGLDLSGISDALRPPPVAAADALASRPVLAASAPARAPAPGP